VLSDSALGGSRGGSATAVLDRLACVRVDRAARSITGVEGRRDPGVVASARGAPPPGRYSAAIVGGPGDHRPGPHGDASSITGSPRVSAARIVRQGALFKRVTPVRSQSVCGPLTRARATTARDGDPGVGQLEAVEETGDLLPRAEHDRARGVLGDEQQCYRLGEVDQRTQLGVVQDRARDTCRHGPGSTRGVANTQSIRGHG
jgi:hypothetical protein